MCGRLRLNSLVTSLCGMRVLKCKVEVNKEKPGIALLKALQNNRSETHLSDIIQASGDGIFRYGHDC